GVGAGGRAGGPRGLGWHPGLTLARPILAAERVPPLVGAAGRFWPLGAFLRRVCLGQIEPTEVEAELQAQLDRFTDLVGHPPTVVNSHQHASVFHPVGAILLELLARRRPLPYVRRVREPWPMLLQVPGARGKRAMLSVLG